MSTLKKHPNNRRTALKNIAGSTLVSLYAPALLAGGYKPPFALKNSGKIQQSVCRWCYKDLPFEDFCKSVKEIGLTSIELVGPKEWPILKKYGLTCAMPWGAGLGITKGFNDPALHDELIENYKAIMAQLASFGYNQIICFSGNRNGMDDHTGLKNCATGLKRLMPVAEKYNITLAMELLNSKVDHPDYQCDHTEWGVALCDEVGSENFKLLYDIYHMQVMEGNVIDTIRKYASYISHYHTAGVPGRHEINGSQELHYPAIMRAILKTGYSGFVGQEFIPSGDDKLASLAQGVRICDVQV